jgi:hypothetical protein
MSVELLWKVLGKKEQPQRMLLTGEEYRWIEHQVFERKVKEYYKMLTQIKEER